MSLEKVLRQFSVLVIVVGLIGSLVIYYKQKHQVKRTPVPPRQEINITIIPGWNLRDVANMLVENKIIKTADDLYDLTGSPAKFYSAAKAPVLEFTDASGTEKFPLLRTKAKNVSYEGYLYPDTYRIYADATPKEVLEKIFSNLENKITLEIRAQIESSGKDFFEVLTLASIVQKEAPSKQDMGMVADIFTRRLKKNWALQSCATVNYITGKNDPGVSGTDKSTDSFFNTYKYPGLTPGPIANPSVAAIEAVLNPVKNDYWYFMAGTDGVTRYAKTLEEHNRNVAKYLR